MHRILTDHPVYKQAVEEVARVKGAQLRHQQQATKAEQEYRAAAAAYQQAAVEALREGRERPERPVPPEVDPGLMQRLMTDSLAAQELPREAMRQLAPSLLPQMETRAFEVEETVREFADTMRGLVREASELRVTVAAQRAAAGLPPLENPGVVDVAALFELVVRGDRLLAAKSSGPDDAASWDPDAPRGTQPLLSFNAPAGRR